MSAASSIVRVPRANSAWSSAASLTTTAAGAAESCRLWSSADASTSDFSFAAGPTAAQVAAHASHAVRRHQTGALGLGPFQPFDARDVDTRPRAELVQYLGPGDRALRRRVDQVLVPVLPPRRVAPCAALSLWTSRDAAAATAAHESARTRRIVNLSNWCFRPCISLSRQIA